MEIPTEPPTADPQTDEQRRQQFQQLCGAQELSKLCSNAGLKTVGRGQYFIALDTEEGPNEMEHQCRECALPRNEQKTRAKGWILKNTRIGPVLDMKVCLHQDR